MVIKSDEAIFKNAADHRHKDDFNQFYLSRTLPCTQDPSAAIPHTWDLTDNRVIKCDFSRKTNIEDDQCRIA